MEPNQKDAKSEAPPPVIGAQPQAPTPLDKPAIFFNLKYRVPPLVVHTQEEKDALDPAEWTENSALEPVTPQAQAHYPKLFYNINVPPVVVGSAEYAKSLGGDYKEFAISRDLAKAAEDTAADAEKK